MSTATDDLINTYLAELAREAARLPWNARTELLEDVRSHIEVALAEMREAGAGGAAAGVSDPGGDRVGLGAVGVSAPGGDVVDFGAAGGAAAGVSDPGGDPVDLGGAGGAPEASGDLAGAASLGDRDDLAAVGTGSAADLSAERSSGPTFNGSQDLATGPNAAASPSDRASTPDLSQVRAMLAALGEPSEIVAAALSDDPSLAPLPEPAYAPAPGPAPAAPYPLGTLDLTAVALLLLGGFLAGIGWLVGAVLLWTSTRWSRLEKLVGTLVLPGGIAGGLLAFAAAHAGSRSQCVPDSPCQTIHTGWNPPGWLAALVPAVVVIAPAVTTVYLVNRARRRPGPAASRVALAVMAGVGAVGVLAAAGLVVASSSSSAHGGSATPTPVESSSWSGYVAPISSPAQPMSSTSAP
ncbi:hypothetical protein ABH926_000296 [Catenulispora sp. GP43]|uniref:hypothetical protein n=1 Tax=Catenulispora sp. GP43 TaxID=3156263 RepID=UPI0035176D20